MEKIMGYRLEIYKAEYTYCGGKLFGYISEENLPKCKSWLWLKKHLYIEEDDAYFWDYGADHTTMLYGREYKEFIYLYLEDYKKYGYNNSDTIKELEKSIDYCDDNDVMVLRWE